MKILALEREEPGLSAAEFQPHLCVEARQAWTLYRSGTIRELYFNEETHTAVLVLECATVEEARRALDSLPLVQAGLVRFDIIPLAPYDGFARLFATE